MSGFVSGTLVHTDKGLVPIEQLKVGDMVLSMPEERIGEKAYKRVLKTFKSAEKMPIIGPFPKVYCTANHPFWVDGEGWVATEDLDNFEMNHQVFTLKHGFIYPSYTPNRTRPPFRIGGLYLVATTEQGLALHIQYPENKNVTVGEMPFDLIDFRSGEPLAVYSDDDYSLLGYESRHAIKKMKEDGLTEIPYTIILNGETDRKTILYYNELLSSIMNAGSCDVNAYKDYVYNIEVEDYHTYLVDEIGFWVHQES